MVITKGDLFAACLAQALDDTNDSTGALYDNPRVSAVEGKVWEEALVYYDTVWPKLEAILAAPPLNTGGDDGENT